MGDENALQSLQRECRLLGSRCLTFTSDVRKVDYIQGAVEGTLAEFSNVHVFFNNAGICAYGSAHELTEEEWDTMLDINLKGAWLVSRRIIPWIIERRSDVIINNSSVAGMRGMKRLSHYAASKWGLIELTKSMATGPA